MLVTPDNFNSIFDRIQAAKIRALDTETKGLRPYHGETAFSVIMAIREGSEVNGFYFNFNPGTEGVLATEHAEKLNLLYSEPGVKWYMHNAKFDMHQIWCTFKGEFNGEIYCTRAQGRIEYNEHFGKGYSLEKSLSRIGLAKFDTVKAYVKEFKLAEDVPIPGKKEGYELLHYERVPLSIMLEYAVGDAVGTYLLGMHLEASIASQAAQPGCGGLLDVSENEKRLTKTTFRMERTGIRIDPAYCKRAIDYEMGRSERALSEFKALSGEAYSASPVLFERIFASEKDKWVYGEKTKTGQINPSFTSDVLASFSNPLAKEVLLLRDTKSKLDFYHGFLWHADNEGIVHPNFNPEGTVTGRFSSSDPNFQNLSAEPIVECVACGAGFEERVEVCEKCNSTNLKAPEFLIRRAIIPRPGYIFIMPDYDQMEYKMMFDYAKKLVDEQFKFLGKNPPNLDYYSVMRAVKEQGMDVHKATAQLMGVTRGRAKTLNFMLLYGGGVDKLAHDLGVTREEAYRLKKLYFENLPYIETLIAIVSSAAQKKKYIKNWMGRKCAFPNREFAYKAPNSLIQGGCADVVKKAMVEIDEFLLPLKSRMIMTIHDELPTEVHESEVAFVPRRIKEIMESVYKFDYLPLTSGMEYSTISLADKVKGFPA